MLRCAGLGRAEVDGAGKSGVELADRVFRTLPLLLEGPMDGVLIAGDCRLRAGLLVTEDSSPLEEVFRRLPEGAEARGPLVCWEEVPAICEVLPALLCGPRNGLGICSSLKSSSPGEMGIACVLKTMFAGAEWGAVGNMCCCMKDGRMGGFCTIVFMVPLLEWSSMGEMKSVFCWARSSVEDALRQ